MSEAFLFPFPLSEPTIVSVVVKLAPKSNKDVSSLTLEGFIFVETVESFKI